MPDGRSERVEQWRSIDHFYGRQVRRTERHVYGLQCDAAEVRLSLADGNGTDMSLLIAGLDPVRPSWGPKW